jgi:hypothetical protein
MVAIAHNQSPAAFVALTDMAGDVILDLGLQRLGQHPTGAFADQLVEHRPRGSPGRRAGPQRRCRVQELW